jgi:hypothetical protein
VVSRKWTLTILSLAAAGAVTVGVVAVSGADSGGGKAAAAKDFTPKILKGKWTGEWENLDFGSTGDILANVKFKNSTDKFTPLIDFSDNVLGCPDPPADTITLKDGSGKNKWNDNGFKVVTDSEAFGDFKFTYKDDGHKVTASGNAPCNPSTTFTMDGKLTGSKFSGNVDIEFGDGSGASAKLSAQED